MSPLKILITGASGLLGAHLVACLGPRHRVVGLDRNPWWGDQPADVRLGDLLDDRFVEEAVKESKPDVLIHCAALVNVDLCEEQPDLAARYNEGITRVLAEAAGPGCLFVFITTDGLFEGDRAFTAEDEPPRPRTVYARTKLDGERAVQAVTPNHLVVRTNFYGWSSGRKQTSGEWLVRELQAGRPVTLFDDFFFTPIYVVDLVERLETLVAGEWRGIFHLCGAERVSKYDFGLALAEISGLSVSALSRGSIDAAGLKAPRPKDMSLKCDRFRNLVGGELPDVRAGLRRFLEDRGRPLSERFASSSRTP